MSLESQIRIGFITRWPVRDSAANSGMISAAWQALSRQNAELIQLCSSPQLQPAEKSSWLKKRRQLLPAPARQFIRNQKARIAEKLSAPLEYQNVLNRGVRYGQTLNPLLKKDLKLDVLFSLCISTELYALETDLPIVYFSDATARLINSTYPKYIHRPHQYHQACDELERVALQKVSAGIFASHRARESAVHDHGLPWENSFVVPLGANVTPSEETIAPDAPSPDKLELILVAADPIRKRLDFCIEITEILVNRGIQARLNYIGPPTEQAIRSPAVNYLGFLNLSDEGDRQIHQKALAESHFLLLPSLGEAFGIAPCEAAHFGRPSLVSHVGGLPTAVLHEQTGFVLPLEASASDYADEIEALCHSPERYAKMSTASRDRAVRELNWDAWGRRVMNIIEEVLQETGSKAL